MPNNLPHYSFAEFNTAVEALWWDCRYFADITNLQKEINDSLIMPDLSEQQIKEGIEWLKKH